MIIYNNFFLMPIQSDYRQDQQVELICCSIEGEGLYIHAYMHTLYTYIHTLEHFILIKCCRINIRDV